MELDSWEQVETRRDASGRRTATLPMSRFLCAPLKKREISSTLFNALKDQVKCSQIEIGIPWEVEQSAHRNREAQTRNECRPGLVSALTAPLTLNLPANWHDEGGSNFEIIQSKVTTVNLEWDELWVSTDEGERKHTWMKCVHICRVRTRDPHSQRSPSGQNSVNL
jgi:hypothetical protein